MSRETLEAVRNDFHIANGAGTKYLFPGNWLLLRAERGGLLQQKILPGLQTEIGISEASVATAAARVAAISSPAQRRQPFSRVDLQHGT